jgi:hypothetical protein
MNSHDKIEQHLIQQKARSVDEGNKVCMYRGEQGRMCAAGCLIPDEVYGRHLESKSIAVLKEQGLMEVFPTDITSEELLYWQQYHDSGVFLIRLGVSFNYKKWVDGDEGHHPSLFKEALVATLAPLAVAA